MGIRSCRGLVTVSIRQKPHLGRAPLDHEQGYGQGQHPYQDTHEDECGPPAEMGDDQAHQGGHDQAAYGDSQHGTADGCPASPDEPPGEHTARGDESDAGRADREQRVSKVEEPQRRDEAHQYEAGAGDQGKEGHDLPGSVGLGCVTHERPCDALRDHVDGHRQRYRRPAPSEFALERLDEDAEGVEAGAREKKE